jgi:hypothetical protein
VCSTPLIRVGKQKEKIMEIALQYMANIEKQISLLCEQKLEAERLLRDQLELQQYIADMLVSEKPEIKDIHFNMYSEDDETVVTFKTSKFSDVLFHLVKRYEDRQPFYLRRQIGALERDIKELCQAWEKLDNYRDMGFIDLGEKTVNDFGNRMMEWIDNMNGVGSDS